MQKKSRIMSTVALCLLLGVGIAVWSTTVLAGAAKPGESVVKYDSDKMGDAGPAEFSHPKHKEAFGEEKLNCKPCHMEPPPLFKMKKRTGGELLATMEDMNQGKSCGKCHDGKTEIAGKVPFSTATEEDCAKCHTK